jgi:hypothetical protein
VNSVPPNPADAPVDLEEIEIAEWVHFVREWREALAAGEPTQVEAAR